MNKNASSNKPSYMLNISDISPELKTSAHNYNEIQSFSGSSEDYGKIDIPFGGSNNKKNVKFEVEEEYQSEQESAEF